MKVENEIKFKVGNVKEVRSDLLRLKPEEYIQIKEIDYSFDMQEGFLSHQGKLLRLRRIGKKTVLTFKGPRILSRFKKREEINISFSEFRSIWQLLHRVGFVGLFTKEKIRQRFRYKNVEVCLDRLPFIGYYLEIEGKDKDITRFMAYLDLNMRDAVKESYNQLFNLFCVINQEKIKRFEKILEFSFKCEGGFKKYFSGK